MPMTKKEKKKKEVFVYSQCAKLKVNEAIARLYMLCAEREVCSPKNGRERVYESAAGAAAEADSKTVQAKCFICFFVDGEKRLKLTRSEVCANDK